MESENVIEIDARTALHNSIIFFQHRTSRYTVAVDRESGAIMGKSTCGAPEETIAHVMMEVRRYQQSRVERERELPVKRTPLERDDKLRFGATMRERT